MGRPVLIVRMPKSMQMYCKNIKVTSCQVKNGVIYFHAFGPMGATFTKVATAEYKILQSWWASSCLPYIRRFDDIATTLLYCTESARISVLQAFFDDPDTINILTLPAQRAGSSIV